MAPRRSRATVSPTLHAFGRRLRRYREAKGWSQDSAARRANGGAGVTPQYVGMVETGRTRCTREFAETMDRELDADGQLVELWDDLVKDAAFPVWFDFPSVEEEAVTLESYQPLLVHGLLQTPAYAGALLRGNKEAVEARLKRQAVLTREDPPAPVFSLLLDEVALFRAVGGPAVMREQLEHLLVLSELPDVTVQIVPGHGEHDGNSGSFTVATLEDRSEVAYVDTAARGLTLTDPGDIATITRTLLAVRSLALPVDQSADLIRRTAEERWT